MQKTAIFGGTFNPPHLGHRFMLESIAKLPDFEKILVLPSKLPPHKSGEILSAEHRVNMCRIAFEGVKKAELCLDELYLSGKSYTLNTLKNFSQKGVKNPALIIGGDSLVDFHKWYMYEEILSLAELYVYKRGGISDEQLLSAKEKLEKLGGKITLLDICPPEISSSMVRKGFKKGEDCSEFLNPLVLDYIKENALYRGE